MWVPVSHQSLQTRVYDVTTALPVSRNFLRHLPPYPLHPSKLPGAQGPRHRALKATPKNPPPRHPQLLFLPCKGCCTHKRRSTLPDSTVDRPDHPCLWHPCVPVNHLPAALCTQHSASACRCKLSFDTELEISSTKDAINTGLHRPKSTGLTTGLNRSLPNFGQAPLLVLLSTKVRGEAFQSRGKPLRSK